MQCPGENAANFILGIEIHDGLGGGVVVLYYVVSHVVTVSLSEMQNGTNTLIFILIPILHF